MSKPPHTTAALLALTGINLFNYLDRQVVAAVLTPLKRELGLSDSQLGSVYLAFMLGYFLTAPLFGYLGDRLPRKGLVAAGVAVWSLGTALSGWAPDLAMLLLFRVLVGLGEASYGSISPAWIADLFTPARRNLPISFFYMAIPVGSALGYLLGGAVAAHHGWRAAFWVAGLPGLLLAAALLALREPPRGASEASGPAAAAGGWRAYAGLRRQPDYLLVVAGYAAQTFALGAFSFWGPTFLQRAHGLSLERSSSLFGLWLVTTGLLATLAGGWLATRLQRRSPAGYARLLAVSALLTVPAAFAAFCLPGRGPAEAALVAAMFCIFLPAGPTNTLILETVPVPLRAGAMAASIFAIHLFGDLGSAKMVGMLSDRLGDLRAAILWILPAATVVCALCWAALALRQARVSAPVPPAPPRPA
ncbi:MAG TPA: MFS transporter [Opitutaceae bacterium]|nr:MFS transporter [Opitutaceae bacterium]